MAGNLGQLGLQLRAIWTRLDAAQRTTVGAVLFATVFGLGAMVWYAGQPDYETVFRATDSREMQVAQQALLGQGITFQIDGDRLLVDRSTRGNALGALRAADIDAPDLQQRIDVLGSFAMDRDGRRNLSDQLDKDELERDLRDIPGVLDADIAWRRPERSIFRKFDEAERAGAAVTLDVARGESFRRLGQMAINVVAAGLGIDPKAVVAYHARSGESLSGDPTDPTAAGDARGDAFDQRELELSEQRRRHIQDWLDLAYQGKVAATVKIDLERSWQQTTERLVGENRVTSETIRTEDGRPVAVDAAPVDGDGAASGRATFGGSEEIERAYEARDIGTRQSGQWAPAIARVGVSLFIEKSLGGDAKKIVEGVENIAGASESGAAVVTHTLVDELPEVVHALSGPPRLDSGDSWEQIAALAPHVAQVVAVLVVLVFLRSLLRGNQPSRKQRVQAALASATPTPQGAVSEDDPIQQARREVERLVADDPAAVSRLVENWLAEQKS